MYVRFQINVPAYENASWNFGVCDNEFEYVFSMCMCVNITYLFNK